MFSPEETEPNINQGIYEKMLKAAKEQGGKTCLFCGRHPFYYAEAVAFGPGHICSIVGKREFNISGICEFCYDELFQEVVANESNYEEIN